MGPPKIRFITGRIQWPVATGFSLRQRAVLNSLAARGEVDMLFQTDPDRPSDLPSQWKRLCRRCVAQPCPTMAGKRGGRWRLPLARLLLRVAANRPMPTRPIPKASLTPEAAEILDGEYDVTWIARLNALWRFPPAGGPRSILDIDDVRHREYARRTFSSAYSWKRRLRRWLKHLAWRRAEFSAAISQSPTTPPHSPTRVSPCSKTRDTEGNWRRRDTHG